MYEGKEIWKDIPGYEGFYQVSNQGRVRSVDRVSSGRRYRGKVLKSFPNRDGYLMVSLYKDGVSKQYYVHRLVLLAFIRKSDLNANHKDGNKKHNCLNNLEYVTQLENQRHAAEMGLYPSKLTKEEVVKIRELYDEGNNGCIQQDLADKYEVSVALISLIVNDKIWTHI